MHAIRLHAFGPPGHLVLEELPDLVPGPGEVRVAVAASGVHLLDTTLRRGETGGPLPGGILGLAGRALERVAAGDWRPLVSTYPLAEAGRAHADLEGRRALGKVVLVADEDRAVAGSPPP